MTIVLFNDLKEAFSRDLIFEKVFLHVGRFELNITLSILWEMLNMLLLNAAFCSKFSVRNPNLPKTLL
jgi:hypothetical protein